jgi:competence protein ComEA
VNHIKRENLKKSYTVLVSEELIQISINNSNPDELENLPGIGPALAGRIIEYRRINGTFEKLDDLKKVKGIGNKLFQKLLPYIKL